MPFDIGTGTSPILAVLIEGRRRIEESWFQSAPGTSIPIDGHCAVFAISRQNFGDLTVPALMVLAHAVGMDDLTSVVRWNDMPGRTKDEVLDAYDRAIAAVIAG